MVKRFGYSAASASLEYVRDNSDVCYLLSSGAATFAQVTASSIVSANISGADFTLASSSVGPALTIGAKTSQSVEGSGNATHLYLVSTSAQRINYITTVSAQILTSGNTVDIGSWSVTALQSANNA